MAGRRKSTTTTRAPKHATARKRDAAKSAQPDRHDGDTISSPGPTHQRRARLVADDETRPLGGSDSSEIASVSAQHLGQEPELEASELMIAVESLARVITARLGNSASNTDPKALAVFVMSDRARELAGRISASHEPIIDNGACTLTGRIWISPPTFVAGYSLSLTSEETNAIFEQVQGHGLARLPTLIYDPHATDPEIRFYPSGLADEQAVQRFAIAETTFSFTNLDRVLQRFHETNFVTPDAVRGPLNPWRKADHYIPRQETEAFFQAWLRSALNVAFREYRAMWEIPGTEGRCDLLVVSRHPRHANAWVYHAVLELKVLRSFNSQGHAVAPAVCTKAVNEGAQQTVAYRTEHSARHGMLCCFDMRSPKHCDGDKCFTSINKLANKHGIVLRRYRLYGSSRDLRADKYPLPS